MKFVFAEPYDFEGKTYKELEVDLKKIDGSVIFAAEREMRDSGSLTPLTTFNFRFSCLVLGQICGQPDEFFMKMPGPVLIAIAGYVQNFLNNSGSVSPLQA